MEYVDPIKDIESINAIKNILRHQSQRDLLLFVFGINTGIRVSDLLSLKVEDTWDGEKIKEFLCIRDEKVDEGKAFYINNSVKSVLEKYLSDLDFKGSDYLFKSKRMRNRLHVSKHIELLIMRQKKWGFQGR